MPPRSHRLTLQLALSGLIASAASADPGPQAPATGDELVEVPSLAELEAVEALDRPADDQTPVDEPLVRSTSRLGVPLAEAPGIVTIISAAEIRAMGARSLFEALRYAPELDVTRDSFGFYHVAVRGRRVDTEVLVLLDGHRINDPYDGRILYELPIATVDHIEILRGPGSSLYGNNAFAGVISIYTRKSSGHHLQLHSASNGGDRSRALPASLAMAGYGGKRLGDRLRGYAALELGYERGAELLVFEDSLTRNRMDPDTGLSQSRSCDNQPVATCPDTAYTSLPRTLLRGSAIVDGRSTLRAGDLFNVGLHLLHVDKGPFIGEYDTLTPDTRLSTSRLLASATYELPLRSDRSITLRSETALDLAATDRAIQVAPDGFKELVEGASELFPEGQLKAIDYGEVVLRQDLRLRWSQGRRNALVVGAEVEQTRMPYFRFTTNYDDAGRHHDELGEYFDFPLEQDGATRTVLSLYAEDLLSTPHGFHLVAGGRFDLYSDFGSAISPRAGAIWRRGDLSVKLFYGWAFRAPTFQELYDQTGRIDLGQFVGNPALDASRVQTVEGALLYVAALDNLLLEIAVTGSHSAITDSIDRAPLSGLTNTFLNTSDIGADAASAALRLGLPRQRLALFANFSWQSASADYRYVVPEQGLNVTTVSQLRTVPAWRVDAGVRQQLGKRYTLGLFAEIGGRRQNNERTPLEAQHFFDYPPYAILDAFARVEDIWKGIYMRLAVRNLTNSQVNDEPFRANRMPLGIPRDRLAASATLGLDF